MFKTKKLIQEVEKSNHTYDPGWVNESCTATFKLPVLMYDQVLFQNYYNFFVISAIIG